MLGKCIMVILLVALLVSPILAYPSFAANFNPSAELTLTLSVDVNRQLFTLREEVNIYGTLEVDGVPADNGLIAIRVYNSIDSPISFRTVPTGNFSFSPLVDILRVTPYNASNPSTPTTRIKAGTVGVMKVAFKNYDTFEKSVLVSATIYDGNLIPIGFNSMGWTLGAGLETEVSLPILIPAWAYIGGATVVASVFSTDPITEGIPYCFEKSNTFNITRGPGTTVTDGPNLYNPSIPGSYNSSFKLSPESRTGTYMVEATGSIGVAFTTSSTTFDVQYDEVPPQASFTFTPAKPYVNQTVNFDASGSSAEGYADEIVLYQWDFGDGNKTTRTSPTISHKFNQSITYVVTLNVTDTDGLWCTTAKQVEVQPPTGPTADFIWYPSGNLRITFDASSTLPGWNGTGETEIVEYEWSFGDGNITTVSTPTISHSYVAAGNYSVTLTVTDSESLQNSTTQTVTATELQYPRWDINQDGFVNAKDAIVLGAAFGSEIGDPEYNPAADIDVEGGDGFVNAKDAIILGAHFGESY
ncbi:PKD domain-containing protein [Candidatus Bathyarchaeota archaeon]|nr:PKD domain-containing protein [Candidatus Bathyarchaeota archaeon]